VLRDHNQVIDMFITVDCHVVHRLYGYVLAKTETDTVEDAVCVCVCVCV